MPPADAAAAPAGGQGQQQPQQRGGFLQSIIRVRDSVPVAGSTRAPCPAFVGLRSCTTSLAISAARQALFCPPSPSPSQMLVMWYMMKMFTGGNKGQQGGAGGKDAKVGGCKALPPCRLLLRLATRMQREPVSPPEPLFTPTPCLPAVPDAAPATRTPPGHAPVHLRGSQLEGGGGHGHARLEHPRVPAG